MNKRSLLIVLIMMLFCFPTLTHADDFTLTVQPEIPENQQGDNSNMFNLQMKPGEEKEYTLHIINKGEQNKNVEVSIVNAGTLTAGIIDETNQNAKMVTGAKNLLTDLTKLSDSEVVVPAKGSKDVHFSISAPEKPMPGIVLGGIYVLDKNEKSDNESKANTGVSIHNQMGYPTEIMLSTSDKQIEAKLELGEVNLTSYGGDTSLEIPIQNIQPNIVPDLTVVTNITKKENKEKVRINKKENVQIAPQSIFTHMVKIGDNKITPGKYLAHIKASSEYGLWEWNREFEVSDAKAKELNQNIQSKHTPAWIYIVISLLVFSFLLVLYLIYKIRKLLKRVPEERL